MTSGYDILPTDALPIDGPEAERFRTSVGPPSEALVASVAAVGVLDPVLVRPEGEGGRLVCGFRRVAAARRLGMDEIPIRVLPASTPDEQCLRYALGHNLAGGPIGPAEAARAVQRWEALLGWPDERLRQELLPLMGMPPTEKHLSRLKVIRQLPASARQALAEDRWDPSHVDLLERFAPEHWSTICGALLETCRLTHSEAREVLQNLSDLARRDGVSPTELLDLDPALSPRQRGTDLRRHLQHRRRPGLEAQSARLDELLAELKLPEGVRVKPDRTFESDSLHLVLRLRDAGQWPTMMEKLKQAGRPDLLERLFACLRCEPPRA